MSQITRSLSNLIQQLTKLPGIGPKSAERLAYHLLRVHKSEALALAAAISDVRENVSYCPDCFNLSEGGLCPICRNPNRDRSLLCVVEQPRDLIAIEDSGVYRGLYHILLGRIAPLENIGAEQLTIERLVQRIERGEFKELILATNPTVEGDGTALYVSNLLADQSLAITRLARGVTTGSILEHTNKEVLADALSDRRPF
ncbi:MAG: recombination protein RecR [Planctomycetaceae bacterium]|nr:recombination protein RecR [Planctomycetaceae bacterium]